MPERGKVFDAIRNCITEPKCKDCPWEDCERSKCKRVDVPVSLMLDTLKLLKEQEPRRVLSQRECETLPNHYERKGFCPKCNQVVAWYLNRSYCGFCGQAIKWD